MSCWASHCWNKYYNIGAMKYFRLHYFCKKNMFPSMTNNISHQHQLRIKHTIQFFYKTLYTLLTSDMEYNFYRNKKVKIIGNIYSQSLLLHKHMHILTTLRLVFQGNNIFLACTLSFTPQSP